MNYYSPDWVVNNARPFNFTMGNRNAGKSFGWKRFLIENFKAKKDKTPYCFFGLLYREVEAVDLACPFVFDDVMRLYFPEDTIIYKKQSNGFGMFYLNGEMCGFGMCIKKYVTFKLMPVLQRLNWVVMDECLSEDGKYLKDEFNKIRNIYQTVARGDGQALREDCHFVFISNTVSMVNPFFEAFPQIKSDFKFNTKKLKREEFLLEMILNKDVVDALTNTAFGKSIQGTKYGMYALNNDFYNDNMKFVEKVTGEKQYAYTFILAGNEFGVFKCPGKGLYYISRSVDKTAPKFVFDNDDHDVNFIFVSQRENYIKALDIMYRRDAVRFEDIECKMAFLTLTGLIK